MRNVEYKAELRDPGLGRSIAVGIGAALVATIEQRDTYYRVVSGRLKKREASVDGVAEPVEYIKYERDDRPKPRMSSFDIYTEDEFTERFGEISLPEWLVVEKTRRVYLKDNVRVHLDDVSDLGTFIELEALVTPQQNLARAHEVVEGLRKAFGPALGEPIGVGYADLLGAEERQEGEERHEGT